MLNKNNILLPFFVFLLSLFLSGCNVDQLLNDLSGGSTSSSSQNNNSTQQDGNNQQQDQDGNNQQQDQDGNNQQDGTNDQANGGELYPPVPTGQTDGQVSGPRFYVSKDLPGYDFTDLKGKTVFSIEGESYSKLAFSMSSDGGSGTVGINDYGYDTVNNSWITSYSGQYSYADTLDSQGVATGEEDITTDNGGKYHLVMEKAFETSGTSDTSLADLGVPDLQVYGIKATVTQAPNDYNWKPMQNLQLSATPTSAADLAATMINDGVVIYSGNNGSMAAVMQSNGYSATQGDLIEAASYTTGTYVGTTVVGSWQIVNINNSEILQVQFTDANGSVVSDMAFRVSAAGVDYGYRERQGEVFHMLWVYSSNASALESTIRTQMEQDMNNNNQGSGTDYNTGQYDYYNYSQYGQP